MSSNDPKEQVQSLLAVAYEFIRQAQDIMDRERFTVSFLGKRYCPSNLTREEMEEWELPYRYGWMSPGDGGEWLSSSNMC